MYRLSRIEKGLADSAVAQLFLSFEVKLAENFSRFGKKKKPNCIDTAQRMTTAI